MFDVNKTTEVAAALPHFEAALALLANQDLDPVPPVQLGCDIKALRSLIDRLEAQCARRVERFDRDRGYAPSGDGSATNWLRRHCHMSGATADRHVKFARQLPDLEKTQAALASGQIGIEHALEIARATEDMGAGAEGELLEAARSKDPLEVRQVARELRHRTDPSGMAELALAQQRKRRLRLYQLGDGMLGLEGALPPEGGVALKLCLDSLIGVPPKDDERSQPQRQADALLELCRRQLDSGELPRLGGRKPHLTLVVQAESLAGLHLGGKTLRTPSPGRLVAGRGQRREEDGPALPLKTPPSCLRGRLDRGAAAGRERGAHPTLGPGGRHWDLTTGR